MKKKIPSNVDLCKSKDLNTLILDTPDPLENKQKVTNLGYGEPYSLHISILMKSKTLDSLVLILDFRNFLLGKAKLKYVRLGK